MDKVRGEVTGVDYNDACLSLRFLDYNPADHIDIDTRDIIGVLPVSVDKVAASYDIFWIQSPSGDNGVPTINTSRAPDLPGHFLKRYETVSLFGSTFTDGVQLEFQSNIYVLVSTGSGHQLAKTIYDSIVSPLLSMVKIRDFELVYTESARTVSDFAGSTLRPRARAGVPQAVLLLSGDGGVVDLVNHLMPISDDSFSRPKLALIPTGTGNALANSIGIFHDNTYGLSALLRGSARPLPLFTVRFSSEARLLVDEGQQQEPLPHTTDDGSPVMYGAVVCSWGLHATIVADSDTAEYRKFGTERFKKVAGQALFPPDAEEPHHYKAKVSILKHNENGIHEWRTLQRKEHGYILATLVSKLEKDFTISPASKPLDGKLRLIHFGPLPGQRVMEIMGLAYQNGRHVESAEVEYEEIEALRIEFEGREEDSRWRRVCVDGKIILLGKTGWLEVTKEERTPVDITISS
jgi:diacylglycerol kinase family enzyme